MVRSFVIFSMFLLMAVSANAQKVGYLNTQELISLMPEVKEANSQLEVMKTQFSKRGQDMLQALQTKYQEFQRKQSNGELAPIEAEKQAQSLKEEEQALMNFEQESQQKLMAKSEELLQPMQDKVNNAIKMVAQENGYAYVLDISQGSILYADPASDVSALVKAKLGITKTP
jgi:outer membrane protein